MITIEQAEIACQAAIEAGDWELVWSHYEPLIDELQALQRPQGSLPGAALWYASQGIPVFPCWPGGTRGRDGKPLDKAPMTSNGLKAATTDPAQIQSWWQRAPKANIGLATGVRMDVIDLDGAQAWEQWQQLATQPSVLGRVKTPRPGGWHLWTTPTGRGNRAGMLPGVDFRGTGGYVLAPPSVIVTSDYSGPYRWAVPPVLRAVGQATAAA